MRSEEICSDPPRQRFFIGGRVAPIMFALTPGLAPRAAVEIGVGPRIRRHEPELNGKIGFAFVSH